MKELFEKIKTMQQHYQLSILGIESFQVVANDVKNPKLVVKYADGTTQNYDGFKEILRAMEEIKTNSEKTFKENANQTKKEFIERQEKLKKELLENISEFSLDQIEILKANLKTIEEKLKEVQKEKVRVKTITISEDVHNRVKKHCVENDLKLADFVEDSLLLSINRSLVK